MREAFRDPWVRTLWVFAIGLVLIVAAAFGLLLLGDVIGLFEFDSGLGSEAGGTDG